MKKLLRNSTIALVLISFFAVSCDKVEPAPAPAPEMSIDATITWKPAGEKIEKESKGDVDDAVRGIIHYIKPVLKNCNCNGKWTYEVVTPSKYANFSKWQDPVTGVVRLDSLSGGAYKITITYTCPDGSSISVTRTITFK